MLRGVTDVPAPRGRVPLHSAPQAEARTKPRAESERARHGVRNEEAHALPDRGETPPEIVGVIELTSVRFAYPTRTDVSVLNGFSLTIPANSTAALVGYFRFIH